MVSVAEGERLLTVKEVVELSGLTRRTVYTQMREGRFPTCLKLGERAVRWRLSEIEEWLAGLPRATGDLRK